MDDLKTVLVGVALVLTALAAVAGLVRAIEWLVL